MAGCANGAFYTITLSNDGVVHSFGENNEGQLGLGLNQVRVPRPSQITKLPKINQVSCGYCYTVCVDYDGFVWSFGQNQYGQLGTGNTKSYNIPKKIIKIPPVLSVACGSSHTCIITNNSDLWSCGNNICGQLCLGNKKNKKKFRQTSFSDVIKISLGSCHSLFQTRNEEIYSCGYNKNGECGLGNFQHSQINPTLIPNVPPNIIQFICGYSHNLFLDSEGNVFSFGFNFRGQLGLAHRINQNVLNQIPNIPPIRTISCIFNSSYLILKEIFGVLEIMLMANLELVILQIEMFLQK